MNKKYILKFGLPTLAVLITIIVAALIFGRDKPQPKLSDPKTTILEFKDLSITREELYKRLKSNYGLLAFLEELDLHLLAEYEDVIDVDAVNKKIQEQKDSTGEDTFYDDFARLGIFQAPGETKDDLDQKIFNFYKIDFLKRAYAETQVDIKEADVQEKFEAYQEDVCAIVLTFSSRAGYTNFYNSLKDLSDEDIITEFKEEYAEQLEARDDEDEDEEEKEYLDKDFTCDYERLVYNDTPTALRNFIFNDLTAIDKLEDGKPLAGNAYNSQIKIISGEYIVALKVATANAKENNETEILESIRKELLDSKLTNAFINTEVRKLRESNGLVIYDPELADQYNESQSADYKVYEKTARNGEIVGKINDKEITTSALFDKLKAAYGVSAVLDRVNYHTLASVEGIQLTKEDKADVDRVIQEIKTQFLSSGYGQMFTWLEYIRAMYNAGSEQELKETYAYQVYFVERYILGYEDYEGANPIKNEEVLEKFDIWFNYAPDGKAYKSMIASHILFRFDDVDDEGNPTEEERERVEKLADQVINGVNDSNRLDFDGEVSDPENPNITFKYKHKDDDGEDAEFVEFKGLFNLDISKYPLNTAFGDIANRYSEDPGKPSMGSLGSFGPDVTRQDQNTGRNVPVRMVEPFEKAALETVAGDWYPEPVETEFGLHVIYVSSKTLAPEQPSDFFDLTEEQIEAKIKDKEPLYEAYNSYFTKLKNQVVEERLAAGIVNREVAKLRDELNFKFTDPVLQQHYLKVHELYLREEDAE